MSLRAMAVAGLSALALAASGCGGDSDSGAELSAAFKKRFGEAPWYHHVTGVKMSSEEEDWLVVTMYLDEVSDTLQRAICRAGFSLDSEVDEIKVVQVIRADGGDGGCA